MQKNIEKELRVLYPKHSVYQIRPLGRVVKRMMYRIDSANTYIYNTLKRYGIYSTTEVEKICDMIYALREQQILQR